MLIAVAAKLLVPVLLRDTVNTASESSDVAQTKSATESQGIIVLQPDEGQCVTMKFNNDTGSFNASSPCPKVPLDPSGVPIPLGTSHRLDAIRRSFLSNSR